MIPKIKCTFLTSIFDNLSLWQNSSISLIPPYSRELRPSSKPARMNMEHISSSIRQYSILSEVDNPVIREVSQVKAEVSKCRWLISMKSESSITMGTIFLGSSKCMSVSNSKSRASDASSMLGITQHDTSSMSPCEIYDSPLWNQRNDITSRTDPMWNIAEYSQNRSSESSWSSSERSIDSSRSIFPSSSPMIPACRVRQEKSPDTCRSRDSMGVDVAGHMYGALEKSGKSRSGKWRWKMGICEWGIV